MIKIHSVCFKYQVNMIVFSIIYVTLSLATFILIFKWCKGVVRKFRMMSKFPVTDDYIFMIGTTHAFLPKDEMFTKVRSFAKTLYPHFRTNVLHYVAVNILAPEDCEIFMSTKKHSKKGWIYNGLKVWLNEGLLLSHGEKWLERRRLLTQAFHFNILKDFLNVFNEETQRTVELIHDRCGEPIEVTGIVAQFTLLSICETAMGYKMDPDDKRFKNYLKTVHEFDELMLYKVLRPWLTIPILNLLTPTYWTERKYVNTMHEFSRTLIKNRMESFNSNTADSNEPSEELVFGKKKRREAMLDVLLRANKEENLIDFEGICEEVDTFMFEGHDTTATAISFCLMLLANHPDAQEKIMVEIEEVLQGKTTNPTYDQMQKMEYLERCIKESLRLYPSVAFIGRIADEDTKLHSGLVVPEDTLVHIHIYDVLRNPRIFPNPDEFDPDRFTREEFIGRHPFSYIPFSAGTRNCIGQKYAILEIKSFLIGVLTNFVLTPVDTPETLVLTSGMVLRSQNGIRVKFTPRR